jgi:hypothetical protein
MEEVSVTHFVVFYFIFYALCCLYFVWYLHPPEYNINQIYSLLQGRKSRIFAFPSFVSFSTFESLENETNEE